MRQKDIDQLADIWANEVRTLDPIEAPGMEVAIGQVVRTLKYAQAFNANLDFTRLEALVQDCRNIQSEAATT